MTDHACAKVAVIGTDRYPCHSHEGGIPDHHFAAHWPPCPAPYCKLPPGHRGLHDIPAGTVTVVDTQTGATCQTLDELLPGAPALREKARQLDFHPEKIPIAEYPYPAGTGVRGLCVSTVIDRGGCTFLACCAVHERAGTASGFYALRDKGRILAQLEPLGFPPPDDCGRDASVTEWQESDVGTALPCGCEVGRFTFPCVLHAEPWGVAQTDCGDCRFGVPAVLHECGG